MTDCWVATGLSSGIASVELGAATAVVGGQRKHLLR
jgi:hypothetical protein